MPVGLVDGYVVVSFGQVELAEHLGALDVVGEGSEVGERKWYFSGIYRSEEKYFRFCCVHGKVKVVRNQVYRRSKVVLGVLRVLSTLVVEFSAKKGPILLLK